MIIEKWIIIRRFNYNNHSIYNANCVLKCAWCIESSSWTKNWKKKKLTKRVVWSKEGVQTYRANIKVVHTRNWKEIVKSSLDCIKNISRPDLSYFLPPGTLFKKEYVCLWNKSYLRNWYNSSILISIVFLYV